MQDFENNENLTPSDRHMPDGSNGNMPENTNDTPCPRPPEPLGQENAPGADENQEPVCSAYPYGKPEQNETQQPDTGYARPYNANQYPNGQQNRQYTTNGQPPLGGGSSYPYGGTPEHSGEPPRKKSSGMVVLIVLFCIILLVAGIGIAGFLRSGSESSYTPSAGIEEKLTNANGPSIDIVKESPLASEDNEPAASANGDLSPQQVYKNIRESSVGILLYEKNTKQLASEGSGVIIGEDSDGKYTYIVTCAHVINAADMTFKVMLFDDTTYTAEVVGYDTRTDIGVLRVAASGLKKAEFGDTNSLEVGQAVYAIGNPGGSEFAGSFTNGIISAIARPIASKTGYTTKCIQHTAAINPGNSGGALVNGYGQVIGINSMKIVETEYEGMGFAVPSDVVRDIVNELITFGYIPDRAKLGITYVPASSNETYSMVVQIKGLPKGAVVIKGISSDSDLNNTEAKEGDMIVAVNGKDMDDTEVLASLIEKASIGDTLTLSMVRINEDYSLTEFNVKVKLVADMGSAVAATEQTVPQTTAGNAFGFNPFE